MEDIIGMIIELIDEDENIVKAKVLGITEYKGEKYAFLLPTEQNENVEEDEILVFRYSEEGILDTIDDEKLLQEVFDYYLAEMEGEIDDEEGAD